MRRVFGSFNQTAVYHARNLLEGAGIQVLVKNAALSSAMGELPPSECQAELWVLNDADVERAREILSAQPAGSEWSCAGCGETLGPQFTQCWRCQKMRAE
jgi:hypothetical protein